MAREYTHIKELEKEIFEMKDQGKPNREIAKHFGFKDKYVVKQLVSRHTSQRNRRMPTNGAAATSVQKYS